MEVTRFADAVDFLVERQKLIQYDPEALDGCCRFDFSARYVDRCDTIRTCAPATDRKLDRVRLSWTGNYVIVLSPLSGAARGF